jgi:hypothetical protein
MHTNRLTPMVTGVLLFASALALAAEDQRSATAVAPVLSSLLPGGQDQPAVQSPRLAMGRPGMMGGPGMMGSPGRWGGYGPSNGYGPMGGYGPQGGYGPLGARGTPSGRTGPQAGSMARPSQSR